MAKAGIFHEDDRVELIDGEIIQMPPIGRRHAATVDRVTFHFFRAFEGAVQVRVQNPIRLDEWNEPQPGVTLLRVRADFYTSGHPTSEDILLVVEVADSSAQFDRRVKLPLYARKGIPEIWLVDLRRETMAVHRDPAPDGYRTSTVLRRGDRIAPVAFPDREIAIADILGEG
jgi:Uma2 family endonuclease